MKRRSFLEMLALAVFAGPVLLAERRSARRQRLAAVSINSRPLTMADLEHAIAEMGKRHPTGYYQPRFPYFFCPPCTEVHVSEIVRLLQPTDLFC